MFVATNNDFDIQPTKHVENKRSYKHYYIILYTLLDDWTIDHIGPRVIPSFVGQDRMGMAIKPQMEEATWRPKKQFTCNKYV